VQLGLLLSSVASQPDERFTTGPDDVTLFITSTTLHSIGSTLRTRFEGTLNVADPLIWPGVTALNATSSGSCDMQFTDGAIINGIIDI